MNTNAEYYVQPSYFKKKCIKLKRKAKAKVFAMAGAVSGDYTAEKINITWADKPSRFDLINELITKNNYQNYLEIGCSADACFQNIAAPNKIGVDPFSGGTHRMTSDEFFKNNTQKFDIIFIDGLHQYAQVRQDMLNAVEALTDDGIILVHDCLSLNFYAQLPFPSGGNWNGDVWKAFVEIRTLKNIDSAVCLIDHGVGIIKKRSNQKPLNLLPESFIGLLFKDFVKNYSNWLNTVSYEEALKFCK